MNIENLVERELAVEVEVLGGNLSQCHFINKPHMTWLGIKPEPTWREAGY
jgi:hypothetical protein